MRLGSASDEKGALNNMRRFFRKLRQDMRGAVTVFVTLLLIPALLITGTGVDVARMYAANSILHDANQLAANAALASYDALLQDLYGLFGIMTGDEEIAKALSLDDYIKDSIFPKDGKTGRGTFQLFYGSNLQPTELEAQKNLSDPEVLRRQIEDYSKFRAPAVIVSEILDRLDTFEEVQETAEIIHDKMEIEEELEDLEKIYRKIYDRINEANGGKEYVKNFLSIINSRIDDIKIQFTKMYNARDDYYRALENPEYDDPPLMEGAAYTTKEDVSTYLHYYRHLPYHFITKDDAETKFGWRNPGTVSSADIMAKGLCFGGDPYGNRERHSELLDRTDWYECDINTLYATDRGAERLIYCTDGERIYYSPDHYNHLELLYDGFEVQENKKADDYTKKYNQHLANIRALVNGGTVSDYAIGGFQNGTYHMGHKTAHEEITRNQSALGAIDGAESALESYRQDINNLVSDCKDADRKKADIQNKISQLRLKLDTANCSEEVRRGIKEKLREYEELAGYNLQTLAEAMQRQDVPVLTKIKDQLSTMGYGDATHGSTGYKRFYSFSDLGKISENGDFAISQNTAADRPDYLREIDAVTPKKYSGFGEYEHFQDLSTDHEKFYDYLKALFEGDKDKGMKNHIKDNVAKAMGEIQKQFKGLLEFEPEGAKKYSRGSDEEEEDSTDFGQSGDWSKKGKGEESVKKSLDSSLVKSLSSGLDSIANDLLLLTYASEMFSCYSTNKREGEPAEKSMSGIPFGVRVNYFYQSELEYLYHGNEKNAVANLAAVTGMIYLIRFVLDYMVSFSIDEVNNAVNTVKTALAGLGPFATVAGELVRVAMALGEGVMDVSRLKNGSEVTLLKNNQTWRFSLSGINGTLGTISFSKGETAGSDDDESAALSYRDYMRLFLLLSNKDTLARRVSHLIELNVTNYKEKIGSKESREAREQAMSGAELFKLEKAVTDFQITTKIDMRMLFLSMPFAQRGVNGVVPPGKVPLSVTDYRGY